MVQTTFAPFVIVMSNFKDSLMGSREAPDFFGDFPLFPLEMIIVMFAKTMGMSWLALLDTK